MKKAIQTILTRVQKYGSYGILKTTARELGWHTEDDIRDALAKHGNYRVYYQSRLRSFHIASATSSAERAERNMRQAKANHIYPTNLSMEDVKALWRRLRLPGTLEVWCNKDKNTYFKVELSTI